ncbi:MAG: aldehyde ferredoxin oxidoreductase C-terminal domain-containing protein [Bacillota bacterium]
MTVYRVDVGKRKVKRQQLSESYAMLGARGLVSAIIAEEVAPGCDPLGPDNKIVFAPGILGGTIVPSSSRTSLGTKSPLTGGIKESSAGGPGGGYLGKLGIRAVIIEGFPQDERWFYLKIDRDGARLLPANGITGLGCYDACEELLKAHGEKCSVFVIGPAGEMKLLAANVAATDKEGKPTRQFGRGGVGAVMGSKQIKAIVIDASSAGFVEPIKKGLLREAVKEFARTLLDNPVSGSALPKYGTAVLVNMINNIGAFPTRNFSSGTFEGAELISGETMTEILKKRGGKVGHACTPGCIIRCSNIYVNDKGKEITGGFEYESICLLGANLGIGELDEIAYLNRLCDDFGLDAIEVGAALGIAMEAGVLEFGDFRDAEEAIKSIAQGTILGRILGQGAVVTGKVLGVRRVPAVKGQAMAAYDPRVIKGMGAVYATSPMGADHTAGPSCTTFIRARREDQVRLAQEYQIKAAAMENTGLCRFCCYALFAHDKKALKALFDIIDGYYGVQMSEEEFWEQGRKILELERDFNKKAGFIQSDDRIPEFMKREKLPPAGEVFDLSDNELDSIFDLSGEIKL